MIRWRLVLGVLLAVAVVMAWRSTTSAEVDPIVVDPAVGGADGSCCAACCPGGDSADDGSRIYLEIRGVPGEAPDAAHLGQIEVLSYAHDMKRWAARPQANAPLGRSSSETCG